MANLELGTPCVRVLFDTCIDSHLKFMHQFQLSSVSHVFLEKPKSCLGLVLCIVEGALPTAIATSDPTRRPRVHRASVQFLYLVRKSIFAFRRGGSQGLSAFFVTLDPIWATVP